MVPKSSNPDTLKYRVIEPCAILQVGCTNRSKTTLATPYQCNNIRSDDFTRLTGGFEFACAVTG